MVYKILTKCGIFAAQNFPPIERVACPHATMHLFSLKLLALNMGLHDDGM